MTTIKAENTDVELYQVQDITPHNKALYEAGKKILVDSVDVGREFCKFMTTTTLGAIPTYLALLKLVLPKDYSLQSHDEVIFLLPALTFLAASILFVLGYFPQKGSLSLDLPDEIERERSVTIRRRYRYAIIAFFLFCAGIIYGSWVLVNRLLVTVHRGFPPRPIFYNELILLNISIIAQPSEII
jgi:hypothetical protein